MAICHETREAWPNKCVAWQSALKFKSFYLVSCQIRAGAQVFAVDYTLLCRVGKL